MLLILDSNEYIFALGETIKPSCKLKRNVSPAAFKEFIGLIDVLTAIDEDSTIPFELGAKFEARGLKASDALIAAFVQSTGAEVLVSENRHFLSRQGNLPFRVINAETCLKLI